MDQIIRQHAHQTPDKEAIVDGSTSLTYSELLTAAEKYAHALTSNGNLRNGEPVGILLPAGLKQVVAQVAVRLVGAVCVPIGISEPSKRIKSMLQEIHVKNLLIDSNAAHEFSEFLCVSVRDVPTGNPNEVIQALTNGTNGTKSTLDTTSNIFTEINNDKGQQISHILFTSGSTGKPKPVQILEGSILHLSLETGITPLRKDDRVAEFNNPSFDLSLFEIWATLLSGAVIVVVPLNTVTDAGALPSFLKSNRVTVTIIPTALFNVIVSTSPHAFQDLRHVLVAGEVASIPAMRSVLKSQPPQHLWNAYGPTECTTMATMFEVSEVETERSQISIGFPVGKADVFLIDDDLQTISESGNRGEICIAGPGVSPGYLNREKEDKESFVTIRPTISGEDTSPIRVYRTGDLGEWRSKLPGCLDFYGRRDNQIKHKSYRIELGEIESILQTDDRVSSAVALKQLNHQSLGLSSLVAYVTLRNDKGRISTDALLRIAKENLPTYMIPDWIEILPSFPLTPNGKVNRQALRGLTSQTEIHDRKKGGQSTVPTEEIDQRSKVIQIWKNVLSLSCVSEDDDFFLLGGSSMQSAAFIALLRGQVGRIVTMDELYRHSRLRELLRFLELKVVDQGDPVDDPLSWKKDIDIIDTLSLVPDWQSEYEGKIFLTGVTGFVGVHLLHHLLYRPNVKQVACLVRSQGEKSGNSRVQSTMERYDLWPLSLEASQKLLVLEGDMAKTDLGLGRDRFEWLTNWASVVFQVGAKINFCESYREHYRSNVLGTYNVLKVAVQGRRKAFHYMSSIDVWGPAGYMLGMQEVTEDGSLLPHLEPLLYDLGYAQSQWTAEGMVRRMQERGLPVTIYRPGFVIGHSQTGASNPNDFITRLIVGCIQMGTFPRLVDMRFEYVTIDFVVASTMHIASSNKNLGRSYHLVAPDQTKSVTMEETCDIINETGYPVKLVDYDLWVRQVLQMQPPGSPLAPLIPMIQERVLGQLTRLEVGQYCPRYDASNSVKALADRPDIQHTPLTTDLLRRKIEFWRRKGFYELSGPINE